MKKNSIYALMGAIALAGSVGFSSCSSSDDVVNNPEFNPEDNAVKTELALNINHPGNRTRMSEANTQANGTFLGMSDMFLFSIHGTPGNADFLPSGSFDLGNLSNSDITSSKSSKVYTMYIPVTTDHFLFYGKNASTAAANVKGILTYNVSKASTGTNAISFNLNPIVASGDVETKVTAPETTLKGYLNTIENTTAWAGTVESTDANYRALANAYNTFTSLAVRQGSSASILRQVQDVYRVASGISTSTPVAAVKTIADAIIANITGTGKGFSVKEGTSGENAELQFTSTDNIVKNFPEEVGLPAGSAVVTFNSTATAGSKFDYVDYTTSSLFGTATPSTLMGNINTPAEIVYFDNSPIRVSTKSVAVNDFPVTSTTWESNDSWTTANGWSGTEVALNTRAVAMQYNIKYGVALLEANVKLGETSLTDNRDAITSHAEANQTNIDGTKLKLTGIVVGGQPSSADWQFLPATGATANQTIFDPITPTALSISNITNYTLTLDNYAAEAASVNVVLEFLNDDKDFYGKDGLIAKGQKFYLVGALDPTGKTITTTWPAGIPQSETNRVFIQDFKTVANFTLDNGATTPTTRKPSLQNAYSVIPDLRSTQMTFGLSVDLVWKTGLSFDVSL